MYKIPKFKKTQLTSIEKLEGEPIEHKIERLIANNEPINDGAPEIFTERKDGVIAAYNIRTDRFEVACEAMDKVSKSITAKRDEKAKEASKKGSEGVINITEGKSIQGEQGAV